MSDTLAEILADRAYERVLDSLKVIGSTPCPVRHPTFICSCPASMAQMNPTKNIIAKRHYYLVPLEAKLLDRDHAWNYTGDIASHDAFIAAEGKTPKNYLTQILLEAPVIKEIVAPSGKLSETIQATLDLWLARTKQWRERYGDRKTAQRKWFDEAYPEMGPSFTVPWDQVFVRREASAGNNERQ